MGKRRNADKKSYSAAEASAATSMNRGACRSNTNRFSAFDFNDDDLLVEAESRKTLAKFGPKCPTNKPARRRKSLDKFDFLSCFARGSVTEQKHFGNDERGIAATDGVLQDRTFGTDIDMSLSSLECQSLESTSGVKSCVGRRKPGCQTAGKKHIQVLHLDSDDDESLELGSLSSSVNMGENEGSVKEQSSEYGANSNDCEALVVVAPYYVKHEKNYYRTCHLTFSQRCIRLEGSPLCDRKRTRCVEWPTSDILSIEQQQCKSDNAEVINVHFSYKDANADETGSSTLGSVELEFAILDDPQWSEKQEEIKSLDLKYEASWKTRATECNFDESFEEVVYPKGDPDAVTISRRDFKLLQPRTFINDTIIDFYTRYLLNKTKAEERHRFHFFSTFFFQKLVAVRPKSSRGCGGKDAFRSVRKWTRNVNLFEKEYIFIPVNSSLHWSLIIICHPGEVAKFNNKNMDQSSKVPCILHMDSIRGSHIGFEKLIRSYLWEEWKERGNELEKKLEKKIEVKFLQLDFVLLQLPQQENLSDCGLFLLHYAELFLDMALECSTTKYIDILNQDWFLPAEVSLKKRYHIKKLIHKLFQDNAQTDTAAASNNKYVQKLGRGVGESSATAVPESGKKELRCRINLNPADDLDIPEQQCITPVSNQRNSEQSFPDECYQPHKLQIPTNQFNNLSLPMEEAFAEQTPVPERDIGSSYEMDEVTPPRRQLNHLVGGETCSEESVGVVAVQNSESGDEKSAVTSKDLAACVVEDSEDESEVETIRRTRRHLISNRPFGM